MPSRIAYVGTHIDEYALACFSNKFSMEIYLYGIMFLYKISSWVERQSLKIHWIRILSASNCSLIRSEYSRLSPSKPMLEVPPKRQTSSNTVIGDITRFYDSEKTQGFVYGNHQLFFHFTNIFCHFYLSCRNRYKIIYPNLIQ